MSSTATVIVVSAFDIDGRSSASRNTLPRALNATIAGTMPMVVPAMYAVNGTRPAPHSR